VSEYFGRLWKELVALGTAMAVVAAAIGIFVKGGLFLPLTAAALIFVPGFGIANLRAVTKLQAERKGLDAQLSAVQAEVSRLTTERDDARRERDIAHTALTVLDSVTHDVSVTVNVAPQLKTRRLKPSKKIQQLPASTAEAPAPAAHAPALPPAVQQSDLPQLPPATEELTPPPDEPNLGGS